MEDTMTNTANQSLTLIQHGRAVGHGYLELNLHYLGTRTSQSALPVQRQRHPHGVAADHVVYDRPVSKHCAILSRLDSRLAIHCLRMDPEASQYPTIIAVMHHLANGMLVFHLEALRIYAAHLEAHTASNQDSPYLIPRTFPISQLLFAHHLSTQSLISLPQTLTLLNFNLDQTTAAGH
ncbi:hypothetical protein FOQG_05606 [Fusarium oxysporum f. sp. raphani 54005]|uniref:Uncharacterized protein n=1 Tax=Fusarium oxysporum f. sp. raphani 54005 TaxID=1089458 RepID=X0CE47_FUSOX|nr:hypothetical protein FOQG_05606 [Fusarium oxysporum f. sp. raphani 54005]